MAKQDILLYNSTSSRFETSTLGTNTARIKGDSSALLSVQSGSTELFKVDTSTAAVTIAATITASGDFSASLASSASFGNVVFTKVSGDASAMTSVNEVGHISGSTQIATDVSGAFDSGFSLKTGDISGSITSTGSFATVNATDFDVASVAGLVLLKDVSESPGTLSGSAQIASDVSGSFQRGLRYSGNMRGAIGGWSEGGKMLDGSHHAGAADGTQTAAIAATGITANSGYTGFICTEEYDGAVWTRGGALTSGACQATLFGSQNSAQVQGGYGSVSQTYDGTSWSETAAMISTKTWLSSAGSTGASAIVYGNDVNTECWNGTSWSEVNNTNVARFSHELSSGTSNSSALHLSGRGGSPAADCNCTEEWDGTNWSVGTISPAPGSYANMGVGTANAYFASFGSAQAYHYDGTSWARTYGYGPLATPSGLAQSHGKMWKCSEGERHGYSAGAGNSDHALEIGGGTGDYYTQGNTSHYDIGLTFCGSFSEVYADNYFKRTNIESMTNRTVVGSISGSSQIASDISGSFAKGFGFTGKLGPQINPGYVTSSFLFDGTSDYFDIQTFDTYYSATLINNFSIAGWFKHSSLIPSSETDGIISNHDNNANGIRVDLQRDNQWPRRAVGRFAVRMGNLPSNGEDATGGRHYYNDHVLSYNKWYFFVWTKSSTAGSTLQINDFEPQTSASFTGSIAQSSGKDLMWGCYHDPPGFEWAGNLSEIAIWTGSLSQSAFDTLYNGGHPIDLMTNTGNYQQSSSLLMYLSATSASHDGTNWQVHDLSGFGNSGSSVNMDSSKLIQGDYPIGGGIISSSNIYADEYFVTDIAGFYDYKPSGMVTSSAQIASDISGSFAKGFSFSGAVQAANVWSRGGALGTARYQGGGFGTQNAGALAGGNPGTACTELYNGTTWSEVNNLINARYDGSGAGIQDAGLYVGGYPSVAYTEEFDGTNWSAGGALIKTGRSATAFGTQNAAQYTGGNRAPAGSHSALSEQYNGSAWSEVGDLINARAALAGAGTQNSAVVFGGAGAGNAVACTEEWDGSSWSAGGALIINNRLMGGFGSSANDAVSAAGCEDANATEQYDGTAWTTKANMVEGGRKGAGIGSTSAGLVTGFMNPGASSISEEWTIGGTGSFGFLYAGDYSGDVSGMTNVNERGYVSGSGQLASAISGSIQGGFRVTGSNRIYNAGGIAEDNVLYLDGTDDYLHVSDSGDWDFGTGSFTLEGFFYHNGDWGAIETMFAHGGNAGGSDVTGWTVNQESNGSRLNWINYNDTPSYNTAGHQTFIFADSLSPGLLDDEWNHIAVVHSGSYTATYQSSSIGLYINGDRVAIKKMNGSFSYGAGKRLTIGGAHDGTRTFNGYIDGVRISKGIQRYPTQGQSVTITSASFTVPNKPFVSDIYTNFLLQASNDTRNVSGSSASPVDFSNLVDSYTKLFIGSNTSNGSTTFTDLSAGKHSITVQGDAHHSTSNPIFGSTSMQFDGDGDRVTAPQSTDWQFGTGDFTIDFWFNWDAVTSNEVPICYGAGNGVEGWKILFDNTHAWWYGYPNVTFSTPHGVTAGVWYHWAVVRKSGIVTQYKNGVAIASGPQTGSMGATSSVGLTIGAINNASSQQWDGYLDEIRISKGIARWTTDFTSSLAGNPSGSISALTYPHLGIGNAHFKRWPGNNTATASLNYVYSDKYVGDSTAVAGITNLYSGSGVLSGSDQIASNISGSIQGGFALGSGSINNLNTQPTIDSLGNGVWTTATKFPIPTQHASATGTQNATLSAGGNTPGGWAGTDTAAAHKYDGTSWTVISVMATARKHFGSAGTQNSGMVFAGNTELYDGSSWTIAAALITAGSRVGDGTQNSALATGVAAPNRTCTEEWNGTSWSAGGALNVGRGYGTGFGGEAAVNAFVYAGGESVPQGESTELYNGTSWSVGANFLINNCLVSGGGTQNDGLAFGGRRHSALTVEYDGTIWTAVGPMSTPANCRGAGGNQAAMNAHGGGTTFVYLDDTEHYNQMYVATASFSQMNSDHFQTEEITITGSAVQIPVFGSTFNVDTKHYPSFQKQAGVNKDWRYRGTGSFNSCTEYLDSDMAGQLFITNDGRLNFTYPSSSLGYNPDTVSSGSYGSWSTGGSMVIGSCEFGGAGSQNAGLVFNGRGSGPVHPGGTCFTEEYNGGVWSVANHTVDSSRYCNEGLGTQNAAASVGGYSCTCTEEYNGSVWATGGALSQNRYGHIAAGSVNAALAAGGGTSNAIRITAEEYNGTSWAAAGTMADAGMNFEGTGTQNAAIATMGDPAGTCTRHYNGINWSYGGALATSRCKGGVTGVQNAAVAFGGYISPANSALTEEYNGTSWSNSSTLNTARCSLAYAGSSGAHALAAGGNPNNVTCTEEYYGGTFHATLSTWSAAANMITGRKGFATGGVASTQTAAFIAGGYTPSVVTNTEEWDGIVWTAGGSLNNARATTTGAGSVNAGLTISGHGGGGTNKQTEEYNGYVWVNRNDMITAKSYSNSTGTVNAALSFAGDPSNTVTEEYNGETWSTVASMIQANSSGMATGTQNASLSIAGATDQDCTQEYNGLVWGSGGNMIDTGYDGAINSAGTVNAALTAGGTGRTTSTEEYDGATWSATTVLPGARTHSGMSGTQHQSLIYGGSVSVYGAIINTTYFYNRSHSGRPYLLTKKIKAQE